MSNEYFWLQYNWKPSIRWYWKSRVMSNSMTCKTNIYNKILYFNFTTFHYLKVQIQEPKAKYILLDFDFFLEFLSIWSSVTEQMCAEPLLENLSWILQLFFRGYLCPRLISSPSLSRPKIFLEFCQNKKSYDHLKFHF